MPEQKHHMGIPAPSVTTASLPEESTQRLTTLLGAVNLSRMFFYGWPESSTRVLKGLGGGGPGGGPATV